MCSTDRVRPENLLGKLVQIRILLLFEDSQASQEVAFYRRVHVGHFQISINLEERFGFPSFEHDRVVSVQSESSRETGHRGTASSVLIDVQPSEILCQLQVLRFVSSSRTSTQERVGHDVEEGRQAVDDHGDCLDDEDGTEHCEEEESEWVHLVGIFVIWILAGPGYVDRSSVQLEEEESDDEDGVGEEECDGDAVSEGLQFLLCFLLLFFVLRQRFQILLDQVLQ